jgi:hypothetical protein
MPLLTAAQRKNRLLWARKHRNWTKEMWEQVLFSDESTLCIFSNQSTGYVRRFVEEEFKPECLNYSVKHAAKVMVWGYMAASGVGRLHIVQGTVNAEKYINILQNVMLPSAQQLFPGQFQSRMTMLHATEQRQWLTG